MQTGNKLAYMKTMIMLEWLRVFSCICTHTHTHTVSDRESVECWMIFCMHSTMCVWDVENGGDCYQENEGCEKRKRDRERDVLARKRKNDAKWKMYTYTQRDTLLIFRAIETKSANKFRHRNTHCKSNDLNLWQYGLTVSFPIRI